MANSTTESTTKTIAFNNNNGHSNLDYEVSIDYGRASTSSLESVGTTASGKLNLIATRSAASVNQTVALSTYDRVISHTEKTTPDTLSERAVHRHSRWPHNTMPDRKGLIFRMLKLSSRTETLASGTVQSGNLRRRHIHCQCCGCCSRYIELYRQWRRWNRQLVSDCDGQKPLKFSRTRISM